MNEQKLLTIKFNLTSIQTKPHQLVIVVVAAPTLTCMIMSWTRERIGKGKWEGQQPKLYKWILDPTGEKEKESLSPTGWLLALRLVKCYYFSSHSSHSSFHISYAFAILCHAQLCTCNVMMPCIGPRTLATQSQSFGKK